MFENYKFKKYKDDPSKLLEFFEDSRDLRRMSLERLMELKSKRKLLYIAKHHRKYRNEVIGFLEDDMELDSEECRDILKWLHISSYHKDFVKFVVYKFNNRIIRDFLDDEDIDSISKVSLKKIWQKKRKDNGEDLEDDEFLKLKLWFEESSFSNAFAKKKDSIEEVFKERLTYYLDNRENFDNEQELAFFRQTLSEFYKLDENNHVLPATILNLSSIPMSQKLELCREVYPFTQENFIHYITNIGSIFLTKKSFEKYFSNILLKRIIKEYYKSSFNAFLFYLYERYNFFKWLKKFIPHFDIFEKLNSICPINKHYYLFSNYNVTILELVKDEKLITLFRKTSKRLRKQLLKNIEKNQDFSKILDLLFLIGGEENCKLMKSFFERDIVENIEEVRKKINKQYLKLKMEIEDPKKLAKILKSEKKEKESLISAELYNLLTGRFFYNVNKREIKTKNFKDMILNNMPNLEKFKYNSTKIGKLYLVEFITNFELHEYTDLIKSFTKEKDILGIVSIILLVKFKKMKADEIAKILKSKDVDFKKEITKYVSASYSDEILFDLYKTENPSIVKILLKKIIKFPFKRQVTILNEFFKKTSNHLKPLIADLMGAEKNEFYIPFLLELLKNADTKTYRAVIKNLGEIDHNVSINLLKNLNLENNDLLKIERAKSLVKLGKNEGWKSLYAYSKIPNSAVTYYVKKYIIQLSSGENLFFLNKFVNDSNAKISTMALGKFLYYDEAFGKKLLKEKFLNNGIEGLFYLSLLLKNFELSETKDILTKIFNLNSYAAKTIVALHFLDHNDSQFFDKLNQKINSMGKFELIQVMQGLKEYPHEKTISWLKVILERKDEDLLKDLVEIIPLYDFKRAFSLVSNSWNYYDVDLKNILARLFWKIEDVRVLHYLNKLKLEEYDLETRIELAFAFVIHGNKKGWEILEKIIQKEMIKYKSLAIKRISSLQSLFVLGKLKTFLRTPDVKLLGIVIEAIGETTLSEGIQYLDKYVSHSDSKIRLTTAKALTKIPHKRSYDKLKFLINDDNNLVKMTAKIGRTNFKSFTIDEESITKELKKIFQVKAKRVSTKNMQIEYESLKEEISDVVAPKLSTFKDKVIVDKEEYLEKTEKINDDLKEKMIHSSDVDEIVKLKKEAQDKIGKITSIENLKASILSTKTEDLEDSKTVIKTVIESKKIELIRVLLFAASNFVDDEWNWVFHEIIENITDHSLSSLIFYSIHKRESSSVIPLYINLIEFDNAKYLLLYWYLYFMLNPENLKIKDLKKAKDVFSKKNISKNYKYFVRDILNDLVSKL